MLTRRLGLLAVAAAMLCACAPTQSQTTNLRITLPGHDSIFRNRARYTCDPNAAKLNLPAGPFTVEYLAVGDNGLALVPVDGTRLIFARVLSASGEHFAAGEYEWGDKGNDAWLTSVRVRKDGQPLTTHCHELR